MSANPSAGQREVSCLALTFFFDYLQARGVDSGPLLVDLPQPPEFFRDRLNWMPYPTFIEIERRVQACFPDDPEVYFHIGNTFPDTGGLGFLRILVRSVLSPFQVYSQFPRLVKRFLFPFVDIRFERLAEGHLRGHYHFHDGFPPSDAFLDTVRGILTGVPTTMGAPKATVTLFRPGPQDAVFDVRIERWTSLSERVAAWLRRLPTLLRRRWRNIGDGATELEETNQLLQGKVDELTIATGQLDRRVRELSILNSLARAATAQIELKPMTRAAVEVMSHELGGVPIAILLAEGNPRGLAVAASFGLDRDSARVLRALASPDAESTRAIIDQRRAVGIAIGGQNWPALPLVSHDQIFGALVVGGNEDASLLEALAAQLAVAVDNAVSYRVIADLRDHLELRVKERTAELEEARTSLEDTVVQLEQADRAKADFFTNVSHELRTPLTLILAPLDEIESGLPRDHAAVAGVGHVRRNARNLLRLVNEILDAAKLDAGRLTMESEVVDLVPMVRDVVATLMPLAERKQLSLTCVTVDEPAVVTGDARMLRRVVVNLVANAIKYVNLADSIEVSVRQEAETYLVDVADTGPGIPEAEQQQVFERFRRASGADGRRIEGTGIGLSMSRGIAQAHGGDIELTSEVGRGSTFRVRLPAATANGELARATIGTSEEERALVSAEEAPAIAPTAPAATTEPVRSPPSTATQGLVLLVEDNEEMRTFLTRTLSRNHRVIAVEDGVAGLAAARAEIPDVIVSDVMMPRMDGYELCRRLKADPLTRSVPVILVSARHGTEAALQGFAAGADDYVVKPFSSPELLARVGAQIRIRQLALAVIRMEKQTTLGVLSSGIAHEVRNPLNAVLNSLGPLRTVIARAAAGQSTPRDGEMGPRLVDAIETSGVRIRKIVDAILTFTRQEETPRLAEVRLDAGIQSVLAILDYRLADNVTVDTEFTFDEPVECYPELLDQVVMNLVLNAADAGARNVCVRTEKSDSAVRIYVRDDGPGVPANLREKIFTPFFTTKDPGQGTGLGLAISREIMALHGGSLELVQGPGEGAEFVLVLPQEHGVREPAAPELATASMPAAP